MSHLKKLSDRIGKFPVSSAKPIEILGKSKSPVLEFPANRPLTITKQIREYQIPSLLLSASKFGLCSLSANQIGFDLAAFVIHKNLENNKWTNYESSPKDYEVYINPTVYSIKGELSSGFEECPSVPNVFTQVDRRDDITIEYTNLEGAYIEEKIKDFKSRVFMHEIDHLWGFLMSSFTVSYGRIIVKDPSKSPALVKVLEENKEKIAESTGRLEKLISKALASHAQNTTTIIEGYEREVIDPDIETQFRELIFEAFYEDFNKP